ncbi:hypothetical protein B9Z55_026197 [Caenorhabditis nigoni]|uniref:Uncharacterized protein n=1 Tax=Caenorhabditis nigoni TaxID=1611254 RepID=A0A2G5T2J6_9PELO|nr:hypothetical protein B9Z55_026197 [Caenorhabditis nigoni]
MPPKRRNTKTGNAPRGRQARLEEDHGGRSRSRSPRFDEDAQLPREEGEARRDELQDRLVQLRDVGNQDQNEEELRQRNPPRNWSPSTIGYSPVPRADTPRYEDEPAPQHVPLQQPIYEQFHRVQVPAPQARHQRAPELPAVHAPFNFDVRDEATLRYWIRHHESLARALRDYGWNMGFRM